MVSGCLQGLAPQGVPWQPRLGAHRVTAALQVHVLLIVFHVVIVPKCQRGLGAGGRASSNAASLLGMPGMPGKGQAGY